MCLYTAAGPRRTAPVPEVDDMIDRRSNHRRLVALAGLALALWGVCAIDARPARAQGTTEENFPCSVRRSAGFCQEECTTGTFFSQCQCLWDPRQMLPEGGECPDGAVCCWNTAPEKHGDEVACLRGGGADPVTYVGGNFIWTADDECKCKPPLVSAGYTVKDFDEDTGKLFRAPFDCRCPFTTVEQWLDTGVCVAPPLGVGKLTISLNFAKPAADVIALSGTLPVPDGFTAAGAQVVVDVGGVVKSFTLDAKGRAKVGSDEVSISVKRKRGVVVAQDARLSVRFAKGTFAPQLQDEGLVDPLANGAPLGSKFEGPVSIGLRVDVNGAVYEKTQPQTYTAKAGKTGKTK
jgi:hypothetical protein